jgi:lipopolysaccharide transport system ATP-binding protein
MTVAIKIENLSKQYRLGLVSTRTLSHDLNRWWQTTIRGKEDPYLTIGEVNDRATRGESEYVWALRDINLEVEQGEVLGIIGKNGAGKSTLLKILSKVTAPTTGTIKTKGRIASLLEVGTGFHYEMTGRENIFMNGAILGMTKSEIKSRLDEIVDFSGCERYIDTPVKRYSSGMLVRLGFAVASHLEPEIIVVDEVLAVGDAEYQKKAIGKMQDISERKGRTVIFVSHNLGAINNMCNNGIILNKGRISYSNKVDKVVEYYINKRVNQDHIFYPDNNIVKMITAQQEKDKIIFRLKYDSEVPIKQPSFGFVIYDNYENPIFGTNPLLNGIKDFGQPKKNGIIEAVILSPFLANGIYPVSIWFEDGHASGKHIFKKENCLNLEIEGMNVTYIEKNPVTLGPVIPMCEWNFR